MEALISNFRQGRHTQYSNQMIIKAKDIDSRKKAYELIGKKVLWKTPSGKEIKGEITSPHGNSGAVKAKFEKGMPGQSVLSKIKIL